MNDELDTVSGRDAYFEESCCGIGADEHGEVVKFEDSDGVAVGMEHVVVVDPVFTGTVQNHRVHDINLP